MLTFFSTPKIFSGHIKVIQRNAIQSWHQLGSACEVILFGDEDGTAEVAAELGVRHVTEVSRNEYGTPLVNDMFDKAQKMASYPILCYINADIILMTDFLLAVKQVSQQRQQFLIVGQHRDLDFSEPLDFIKADWQQSLRTQVLEHGKLHPEGIDYFVFPRGIWGYIPPFAIGRAGWDNWMIYRARFLGLPVVDATRVITAVHQNHDYAHCISGREGVFAGPEAKRNLELMGDKWHIFHMGDANYLLTEDGLKRAVDIKHLVRRMETLPETYPHLPVIKEVVAAFRALAEALLSIRSKLGALWNMK